jgi:hypothetical protein
MTATAAQVTTSSFVSINDTISKDELKNTTIAYVEFAEEEQDEAFDFDIKAYLPVGFNAITSLEYEIVLEEADAPFDFNTKDYLPIGFGLHRSLLDSIEEIAIEEADAPFDFDTKAYLPKGFDVAKKVKSNKAI